MTALAELAARHGLKYQPGKPHKLAVPLSQALSTGDTTVIISNPTETVVDVTVYVRRKWGSSAHKVHPDLIPAVIKEARENVTRVLGIVEEE